MQQYLATPIAPRDAPERSSLSPLGEALLDEFKENSRAFLDRRERESLSRNFEHFVARRAGGHAIDLTIPIRLPGQHLFVLIQSGFDRRRNRDQDPKTLTERIFGAQAIQQLSESKRECLALLVGHLFFSKSARRFDFRFRIPFPVRAIYARLLFGRDRRYRDTDATRDLRRAHATFDLVGGSMIFCWALAGLASIVFLVLYIFKVLAGINVSGDQHLWGFLGF